MATRAKRQPRIEPTFGSGSSSLLDLRLTPQDRASAPGGKSKSRKTSKSGTTKKKSPGKPAKSQRPKSRNGSGGRSGAKRRSGRGKKPAANPVGPRPPDQARRLLERGSRHLGHHRRCRDRRLLRGLSAADLRMAGPRPAA
ncbi:hypothetical protein QW131_23975 [Roseibium salinum]|nr:hypothetical protein [Roseibium salinum]